MEPLCMLWASGERRAPVTFSECCEDLELEELSALLFPGKQKGKAFSFAEILSTAEPESLNLRQEALGTLLAHPELANTLEEVRAQIGELRKCTAGIRENSEGLVGSSGMSGFKETLDKLERLFGTKSNIIEESDLDNYYGQLFRATIFTLHLARAYTAAMRLLRDALNEDICRSQAFARLHAWVEELNQTDRIEENAKRLEELTSGWNGVGGFAVDILVDQTMDIMGVELSDVRQEGYQRAGAATARGTEPWDGISGLSEFPAGGATARLQECLITELGASMKNSLTKLRNEVCRIPVTGVKTLLDLEEVLDFYLGAAGFCGKLRDRGLPLACPSIGGTHWIDAKGVYPASISLIRSQHPVSNDVLLSTGGAVNFITGANSAGKTTYLIAAGQLQWLFQLGCYLPCVEAEMRPAAQVFTLFASGESDTASDSRMGLEAEKLQMLRRQMDRESLVLLNEPMTSTNASEGMAICMDLLREMMAAGVSAMLVTHYNEMYGMLSQEPEAAAHLNSYVMEVDQQADRITYPFRLRRRHPDRSSHAQEIVSKEGLTLPDMLETLTRAGLDVRMEDGAWNSLHPEEEV